ncbi:MAG TPA: hypothetical protein VII01_18195 [Solirubrobacteraceae bacterium]
MLRGVGSRRRGGSATCFSLLAVALASGCGTTVETKTTTANTGPLTVAVDAPSNGTVVTGNSVTVRGTVSPATAQVQVQGKPAVVGNGVFSAEAVVHPGHTKIDVIASAPQQTPTSQTVEVVQQSNQPARQKTKPLVPVTPNGGGGALTSGSSCGGGLSVGPYTTCPFAQNVREVYDREGPGSHTVYSPVTGNTYTMSCSYGHPVVCTGGNNASVYFP